MKYFNKQGFDIAFSNIILGCMRIAALQENQIDTLIKTALDQGITLFDHADIYGADHTCEKLFGNCLKNTPSMREKMLIQTKCGITPMGFDFSKQHIIKQVEDSLSALNTDYIDILLLHRPDTLMQPSEVCEAFNTLKNSGKVKAFGVSNFSPMQMEYLQSGLEDKLMINQLQISCAHSLIFDEGICFNMNGTINCGGVLEYSRLNDIMLQSWSALQFGYFEGCFLGNTEIYQELNDQLQLLATKYNVTKAAIAYAFLTSHPANISVVCGSTNPQHLTECCQTSELALTRSEWYAIYKSANHMIP